MLKTREKPLAIPLPPKKTASGFPFEWATQVQYRLFTLVPPSHNERDRVTQSG